MSSLSKCIVHKLTEIRKHDNAETLELTTLDGFTVAFKQNQYVAGDLVIYIPPDMIVDTTLPEFSFLGDKTRVKAVKLRGILSYGLIVPARPGMVEGQDVTKEINAKPYEVTQYKFDGETLVDGALSKSPKGEVTYTDIQSLRKYDRILRKGEHVVIMEKLHGQNVRFVYQDGELYAGTHHQWLAEKDVPVWRAAKDYNLAKVLEDFPNKIFFGELFGWVQDLRYGHPQGQTSLRIFDIFDIERGRYMDFEEFAKSVLNTWVNTIAHRLICCAPILHSGPWQGLEYHKHLADGPSKECQNEIREGFVVRPIKERYDDHVGRVILKLHGDAYLQRKSKEKRNRGDAISNPSTEAI